MRNNFNARGPLLSGVFSCAFALRLARSVYAAARRDLEHQFGSAEGGSGCALRRGTGPGRAVPARDKVSRGRVSPPGLYRYGTAALSHRRPKGLARRRHRFAPAVRGGASAGRMPRRPCPICRCFDRGRRDPELLHSRRRRHSRPLGEPEVRPQAGLLCASNGPRSRARS